MLCLVIFHLVLNLRIEGGSPDGEPSPTNQRKVCLFIDRPPLLPDKVLTLLDSHRKIAHIPSKKQTCPKASGQILAISLPGLGCQDLFSLGVIGQFLPADIVLSYISSAMIQDQLSILINVQLSFYNSLNYFERLPPLPPSKSLACSRFVESGQKVFRIRKTHFIRCSKNLIGCVFVRLPRFFPKIKFLPRIACKFQLTLLLLVLFRRSTR